jgi:hypothetical protein
MATRSDKLNGVAFILVVKLVVKLVTSVTGAGSAAIALTAIAGTERANKKLLSFIEHPN